MLLANRLAVLVMICTAVLIIGCTEVERHTTIEEHTTRTIDSHPVVTGTSSSVSPLVPGDVTQERIETRQERIISREPVVK